ncbi:MAG: glycosyltransferase [Bacteroidota bacterium]
MTTFIAFLLLFPLLFYAAYTAVMTWSFLQISPTEDKTDGQYPFVSIIIPARNEEQNIERCIRSVCQQNYPTDKYEVICLDDHSTDATLKFLAQLQKEFKQLIVIKMADYPGLSQKKQALSLGIQQSRGEIIVQTDADCWVSREWLETIVSRFGEETGMVSGPVLLHGSANVLERFQTLEYMGLSVLGAGAIQLRKPTMCNGANLAYRKQTFLEVNGFQDIAHIASGDDELLMQKINLQTDWGIRFAKDSRAIVNSQALNSWTDIRAQRLRWVSKARAYLDRSINLVQILFLLSFMNLIILVGLSIWSKYWIGTLITGVLLKVIPDFWILFTAAKFFHKLPLLKYLPILQPAYLLYVIWIGVAGNMVRTYNWKERQVS